MGSIRNVDDTNIGTNKQQQLSSMNVIKTCVIVVEGMTCTNCTNTIENHLKSLNGVVSASVSLLTHKANITYKSK